MNHLFIDTNTYLALYALQEEELEDLKKLVKSIKNNKITLWLPEQVRNEFLRNREKRLYDEYSKIDKLISKNESILSSLKTCKMPDLPESSKELAEIEGCLKISKQKIWEANSFADKLQEIFKSKITKRSFLADKLIEDLFSSSKLVSHTPEVVNKASERSSLGNPPGKKDSYGDAVIWETLLHNFPEGEPLHFVGLDRDFRSKVDENNIAPFLIDEWTNNKKSKIIPYMHLGSFTKHNIPEIESSDKIIAQELEFEKELLFVSPAILHALNVSTQLSNLSEEVRRAVKMVAEVPNLSEEISRATKAMTQIPNFSQEINQGLMVRSMQNSIKNAFPAATVRRKKDSHPVEKSSLPNSPPESV
ncbi:MAG: PIN domain-containing protein [Candidatus Diapherotrites archaeon]